MGRSTEQGQDSSKITLRGSSLTGMNSRVLVPSLLPVNRTASHRSVLLGAVGGGSCPMIRSEDNIYPIKVPWLQIWREMVTYRRIMGCSQNQRKAESADLKKDQAQVGSGGL